MSPTKQSQLNIHFRVTRSGTPKGKRNKENDNTPCKKPAPVATPYKLTSEAENYVHIDTPRPPKRPYSSSKQTAEDISPPKENGFKLARKVLHGSATSSLPGRDKELNEMRSFLESHLENETSGAMYVSGQPGTGKTACLTHLLTEEKIKSNFKIVSVNCSYMQSAVAIYGRICEELSLKVSGRSEKEYLTKIRKYLSSEHKMILLILDEIDQLETKKQNVLYSIFEWPSLPDAKLVLVGIANALDLTDRVLPRLQAKLEKQPQLLHFAPYTKQQIIDIICERFKEGNISYLLDDNALNLLAAKVAAVSGDVRKALDVARCAVDLAENKSKSSVLQPSSNNVSSSSVASLDKIELKEVLATINSVYGTSQVLNAVTGSQPSLPLQQQLIVCSLLLMMDHETKKLDITLGKLYDVFRKVCSKQRLGGVDLSEFISLCDLVQARGILKIHSKTRNRQSKVSLQWDKEELMAILQDKTLLSDILADKKVLYDK
ncbi:unnamed protein product [Bemisia tabaci]|uniref:Cell division control protein n=1 Tax=Bemisia tabaci TaxID=7038 RepID=A0A9P0AJT0_BEMTA|nr:unnamed protein product [Bemisia tabaci]